MDLYGDDLTSDDFVYDIREEPARVYRMMEPRVDDWREPISA